MLLPLSNRTVVGALTVLAVFQALSAFYGAFLAVARDGAGVSLENLEGSPFTTYLVPGLILGGVVGGTQLATAVALLAKRRMALLLAAVAGFGMLIWIFVELVIIRQYSWLQSAYFALGVLELSFVLALLGIAPTLCQPLQWPEVKRSRATDLLDEG